LWNGAVGYAGPSRIHLLKLVIKDPLHISAHLSTHFHLTKAKEWARPGIGIFTMAARKPNEQK
jgi:hypothetical protein